MDNIKIYVMTHTHFCVPQDPIYQPFQVGKAIQPDLGYEGDDTLDSISSLNPYYGELTGLYWIWKNDKENDYVGLCHYRRFFVNERHQLLSKEEYETIFESYDVMTSEAINSDINYYESYKEAHHIIDLEIIYEVIKELTPEYTKAFEDVVFQSKNYYGNLFVAPKKIFDDYANWLFTIFFEAQKRMDVTSYDSYHKRVFGFLSEELLLVWLTYHKYRIYEAHIGVTSEKAETLDLKHALTQLVKNGEFSEGRDLFYEYTALRPDVRLEMSDIFGELPVMEQILYVLEEEKKQNICGLYSVTHNLMDMVKHYLNVIEILKTSNGKNEFDEKEVLYFKEFATSAVLLGMIFLNNPEGAFDKTKAKERCIRFFEKEEKLDFAMEMQKLPY